jgi:hypothetical protein
MRVAVTIRRRKVRRQPDISNWEPLQAGGDGIFVAGVRINVHTFDRRRYQGWIWSP